MKKIVLCIVGIYSFTLLSARTSADSLIAERKDSLRISATSNFSGRLDRFSSSHFYQMTYIGVPLVVGGLIVKVRTTISGVCATIICPGSTAMRTTICSMPLPR